MSYGLSGFLLPLSCLLMMACQKQSMLAKLWGAQGTQFVECNQPFCKEHKYSYIIKGLGTAEDALKNCGLENLPNPSNQGPLVTELGMLAQKRRVQIVQDAQGDAYKIKKGIEEHKQSELYYIGENLGFWWYTGRNWPNSPQPLIVGSFPDRRTNIPRYIVCLAPNSETQRLAAIETDRLMQESKQRERDNAQKAEKDRIALAEEKMKQDPRVKKTAALFEKYKQSHKEKNLELLATVYPEKMSARFIWNGKYIPGAQWANNRNQFFSQVKSVEFSDVVIYKYKSRASVVVVFKELVEDIQGKKETYYGFLETPYRDESRFTTEEVSLNHEDYTRLSGLLRDYD